MGQQYNFINFCFYISGSLLVISSTKNWGEITTIDLLDRFIVLEIDERGTYLEVKEEQPDFKCREDFSLAEYKLVIEIPIENTKQVICAIKEENNDFNGCKEYQRLSIAHRGEKVGLKIVRSNDSYVLHSYSNRNISQQVATA